MKQRIISMAVRLRRRLPGWADRLLDRLIAGQGLTARVLKRFLAGGQVVPEPALPDPGAAVRLLIAPFNYAGQGWAWRTAVDGIFTDSGTVSARNIAISAGQHGFRADTVVPASVFLGSERWHAHMDEAVGQYTHIMIESFGSLLGRGGGDALLDEIRMLRRRGIRVALLCHGSDIRSPHAHTARDPLASIEHWGPGVERFERAAAAGAAALKRFSGTVFVSTLDLLDDVPEGQWLPVVVDPEPWRRAAVAPGVGENARPIVLHVPSDAGMKGTQFIDPVCRHLHDTGVIEYRSLRDVAPEEMPAHVAASDIVIDQLLIGSYGVAACEAMATGRAVIGNVSDRVRRRVLEQTGTDLPIVQADRSDLETVLRRLLADPVARRRASEQGPVFVDAVHAGDLSRAALSKFLTASA